MLLTCRKQEAPSSACSAYYALHGSKCLLAMTRSGVRVAPEVNTLPLLFPMLSLLLNRVALGLARVQLGLQVKLIDSVSRGLDRMPSPFVRAQ